jgi:hypothetical protein
VHLGHERGAERLDTVAARLVAPFAALHVAGDGGRPEQPKAHARGHADHARLELRPAHQGHRRVDRVLAARQLRQHARVLVGVARLLEHVFVDGHGGVGAQHGSVAGPFGDGARLGLGKARDVGARRLPGQARLVDVRGLHAERETEPLQDLEPARRLRREHERARQPHERLSARFRFTRRT